MLIVAPEARWFLLALVLLAVVLHGAVGLLWAWPGWLLALVMLWLLRVSPRDTPAIPAGVLAPVDGTVLAIDTEAHDPYLDRPALHILMRQNSLGEFSMRSPVEAKLLERWLPRERSSNARLRGDANHVAMWLRSDYDEDIIVAFDVAAALHYVKCGKFAGERLGQGQRCGLVGFGRLVDVYLPREARVRVVVSQEVQAGVDQLVDLLRA